MLSSKSSQMLHFAGALVTCKATSKKPTSWVPIPLICPNTLPWSLDSTMTAWPRWYLHTAGGTHNCQSDWYRDAAPGHCKSRKARGQGPVWPCWGTGAMTCSEIQGANASWEGRKYFNCVVHWRPLLKHRYEWEKKVYFGWILNTFSGERYDEGVFFWSFLLDAFPVSYTHLTLPTRRTV